jgi:hypothetical protein
MRSGSPAKRSAPLRSRLREALVLSLSAPLAAAAACRASTGTSPVDAARHDGEDASGSFDAAPESSLDDSGACALVPEEAGRFGEDGSCGSFFALPCGIPSNVAVFGCYPSVDFCLAACPGKLLVACGFPAPTCQDAAVDPGAPVYIDCATCLGNIGRRPAGTAGPRQGRGRSPVGKYFSLASSLERCSVEAFVQLEARLAAFGAPRALRRRARQAASDERRHARTTAGLARRYGGEAVPVPRAAPAQLTFEEFVRENAVEGCVRETYGALLAMHQRERAADPAVRRAMRRIAVDETHHAELAWAIDRWACARLAPLARRNIRARQKAAMTELRAGAGLWHREVVHEAGMPAREVEVRLLDELERSLFLAMP